MSGKRLRIRVFLPLCLSAFSSPFVTRNRICIHLWDRASESENVKRLKTWCPSLTAELLHCAAVHKLLPGNKKENG